MMRNTASAPVMITATTPLVIRPIQPRGFSVETLDGRVIFSCPFPFTDATFSLRPLSREGDAMTFEVGWSE